MLLSKIKFKDIVNQKNKFMHNKRKIFSQIKEGIVIKSKNKEKEEVLIVSGGRGSGKTSLILALSEYLHAKKQPSYYFNLENPEYAQLFNNHPLGLLTLIENQENQNNPTNQGSDKNGKAVIFLDEVQNLNNPTRVLRRLLEETKGKIKIVAFSATSIYLDKRFKKDSLANKKVIELFPLSFSEYKSFSGAKNKKRAWSDFITFGGCPKVALATKDWQKQIFLEESLVTTIKKDLFANGIKNSQKYFALLGLLAAGTGDLVNSNSLAKTLRVSYQTVEEYLAIAAKCYHVAFVKPFYGKHKKELKKMPKVYFFDLGWRNFLIKNFSPITSSADRMDQDAYLENIFFLKLLEKEEGTGSIKFWRTQNKEEVDFVLPHQKKAFQIKFGHDQFSRKEYARFQVEYPDFKLEGITWDKVKNP